MELSTINWLAVVIATIAAFVLGGLWYGPLFGKRWLTLVNLSEEELSSRPPALVFGPAFCLTLVQAVMLAVLIPPTAGVGGGALVGAALGAAFIATGLGVNYLFSGNSRTLWFIDAGYNIAQMALMGAILGY